MAAAKTRRKRDGVSSASRASADEESAAVWVPRSELKPWADNPRHNDGAVAGVVDSIKRFGFAAPIVARRENGEVIAGHTRLKAAEVLGIERVPVRYLDLDPADAHLLAVADNKLNEKADWDEAAVASLLSDYSLEDAGLAGFDSKELERLGSELLGGEGGGTGEEDAPPPPPPADPVTQFGDLWVLGEHRLVCGSSADAQAVQAAMGNAQADLVLTDPPYGVDYEAKAGKVHNDGKAGLANLLSEAFSNAVEACRVGGCWYVFSPPGENLLVFAEQLKERGIWRQTLIWVKNSLVLGHSDYHYRHEVIFYGWKPGATHQSPPDRKQDSIWEFDRPTASKLHPTMKPTAMFAHAIEMSTSEGDLIFDPFLGSGTTIMAAEQLRRRACGVEFSPAYCDVIVERWETLTGSKAKREAA